MATSTSHNLPTFMELPPEILHAILLYLDVPDLLSITRVCHHLRWLAIDPHLHHLRLTCASIALETFLPHRPPIASLRPPVSTILLSRTHIVARAISRSLISIRLTRGLRSRPPSTDLIERHILPRECVGYKGTVAPGILQSRLELGRQKLREGLGRKLERRMSASSLVAANILPGECYRIVVDTRSLQSQTSHQGPEVYGYVAIAPGIVEARRRVIKEGLKDGLRAWVERRAVVMQKRAKGDGAASSGDSLTPLGVVAATAPMNPERERASVKLLARRFAKSIQAANAPTPALPINGSMCACDRHVKQRRPRRWERPVTLGRKVGELDQQPTRAHVLGLRRFWEGVIKGSA